MQPEVTKTAQQLVGDIMPIAQRNPRIKARVITEDEKKKSVFYTLRQTRATERLAGYRKKKAAEKAANDALLKKE